MYLICTFNMNLMIWLQVEFHNYWFWMKFKSFVGENFESRKLRRKIFFEKILESLMIFRQKPNKFHRQTYFISICYFIMIIAKLLVLIKYKIKYCFSYIKTYWMKIMWKTVKLIFLYVVEIIIMGTLMMFVICLIFMAFCVTNYGFWFQ
jgi:hypothetical protein